MTLLADSSSPTKMPGKQLLENRLNFTSNFKHPKLNAVRSFPVNCGANINTSGSQPNDAKNSTLEDCRANASRNSPLNTKLPNVDAVRNYPENRGPFSSRDTKVLSAVPLRSVPAMDVEWDPQNVGQKMAKNDEDKVRSKEEWERDSEKLLALIAEAKEYISACSSEYSTPFEEPKPLKETMTQEKRVREKSLGESLSQKRTKVDDRVSEVVQQQKTCELESEWKDNDDDDDGGGGGGDDDDDDGDDEVCVLSPAEWNVLQLSSSKHKVDSGEASVGKIETNLDLVDAGSKALVDGKRNEELINLTIVEHKKPQGFKVLEALELFEEQHEETLRGNREVRREGKGTKYAPHLETAFRLKAMGMWIPIEKPFGHIPGVEIGDEFRFRAELAVIGVHRQLIAGIDYVVLEGDKFATSIVNSGRYENTSKTSDVLIYSGQGGRNLKKGDKTADQKLEKGNLALVNSMEMGYPVRVTYKTKRNEGHVYVYDGLYMIKNVGQDRDNQCGKLVYKFELHRIPGQPRTHQTNLESRKSMMGMEVCVMDDVSQGKENIPIRAMNVVDDDGPPPFTYITKIVYPSWYRCYEPIGCNCTDGCSDLQKCRCVVKNGGEIPFNENGAIIRAKSVVHECGPACKCPPSCMNRVSQHGPKYQLEIFKTKTRGWGLRSRNYISSGSFICEYVGEMLEEKEAEERIGNDEYLFDVCADGFAIDAFTFGNIGRFINHSCSPNVYAQEVLYDNDDDRMPHIMFFATKNIPPMQELSYDYNYKMGRVCDVNGNIKIKGCFCGSRKCTGRMY